MKPKPINDQAQMNYNGSYERIEFSVIGNSPDLKGDAKSRYKTIRINRGEGYESKKCKVISIIPIEMD